MIGAGKYDQICTEVRLKTRAKGVILVIVDGKKGNGFNCQLPPGLMAAIPNVLRKLATDIERDSKALKI